MKKLSIFLCLVCMALSGCEYIPHKQYKIKTDKGEVITLSCPVIDPERSVFTYLYHGRCILIEGQK